MHEILIHALAGNADVPGARAVLLALRSAFGIVPDPQPAAPPGFAGPTDTVLGWAKWGVIVAGVAGLLMAAGKMVIGHRNRSSLAADGATSIPWVVAGLSLAVAAAGIVAVFI